MTSLKTTSGDNHGYKSSNKTKINDNTLNSHIFGNNDYIDIKGELYGKIVSEIIEENVEQKQKQNVFGGVNNIINKIIIMGKNKNRVTIVDLICSLYIALAQLKQSKRKNKRILLNCKALKALKINLDKKRIIKASKVISKKIGMKLKNMDDDNIRLRFDKLNNIKKDYMDNTDELDDTKKGDTNNVDNDDGFDDDDLNDMKSSIKNETNNDDGFDTEFDDELNNIKTDFIMHKIGIKLPNMNYDNIKLRFDELNNMKKDFIVDNYDELYPTKKDDTNNVDNDDGFDDDDLNDMKSSIKNETNNDDGFDTEFDDEINNYIITNPNEIEQEQQKFDKLYPNWLLKTRNNDNIEPYHISKVTKDGEVMDYIGLRIRDSDDDSE